MIKRITAPLHKEASSEYIGALWELLEIKEFKREIATNPFLYAKLVLNLITSDNKHMIENIYTLINNQ